VQAQGPVKVGEGELLARREVGHARVGGAAGAAAAATVVLAVRGREFGAVDEEELAGGQVPDGVALWGG
jgi:hypothetical protein